LVSIALVVERAGALAREVGSAVGSEAFSLALAFLGCLMLVIGMAHFLRTRYEISLGDYKPSGTACMVVVAGSLALAGAFIACVLLG